MRFVMILAALAALPLQAQNLGDIARAQRNRQQVPTPSRVFVLLEAMPGAEEVQAPDAAPAETEHPSDSADDGPLIEEELQARHLGIVRRRSALLLSLGTFVHDSASVRRVEEEVQGLERQLAEIKLERLIARRNDDDQ